MISVFRPCVVGVFVIPGCYAVQVGSWLATFRNNHRSHSGLPYHWRWDRSRDSVTNYLLVKFKVKVKWSRYRLGVAHRMGRDIALLFHDRGTRRVWVVSSTLQPHFTPGKDPVPILQEAGWAPGPFWMGGKSRPHRDSIPDRSQSLYRLSYPAHSGDITLLFHYRGTRRGWVVSTTPRPHFTPRERQDTHFTGGWVGPRAGLDGRNISFGIRFRTVQPVAQSLYRLSYPAHNYLPVPRNIPEERRPTQQFRKHKNIPAL